MITFPNKQRVSPTEFKAACNRAHARKRAELRYGLALSDDAIGDIEGRIRSGGGGVKLLRPDHRGKDRSLYGLKLDGVWLPAVFDHATDSLMSFLPPRALDPYRQTLEPPPEAPETPPFVPHVTGFIPGITPRATGKPDGPGGEPVRPGGTTIADLDAEIAAGAEKVARLTAAIPHLGRFERASAQREILSTSKLNRGLRRLRHRLHAAPIVTLKGEPGAVGVMADLLDAFTSLAKRTGWGQITEAEQKAAWAAGNHLRGFITLDMVEGGAR